MEIRRLVDLLADAGTIVAFTGAGISTESGIPDFRGPQGLWTTIDPSEFTIENYVSNAEHRRRVWRMRMERASERYEPNAGHVALAALERMGKLGCVITQNIDGLHQAAGNTIVLELHGTTHWVKCLGCDARLPNEPVFARIRAGDEDPHCEDCGGLLKSATVSFGEMLPTDVIEEAFMRAENADAVLVVGSSLVVYPAAGIPLAAARAGARLAIVNAEPTPMDDIASIVLHGAAGEILTAAIDGLRFGMSAALDREAEIEVGGDALENGEHNGRLEALTRMDRPDQKRHPEGGERHPDHHQG
jgi:NAD-dependent deacetylase